VSDGCSPAIAVFPENGSGTLIPTRLIRGPNTEMGTLRGIASFQGEIYVVDSDQKIRVFPANANGNALPSRVIAGSHTGLTAVHSVFVR